MENNNEQFESSEPKEYEDTPNFNELSESERQFALSIKELSSVSEEQFLDEYPDLRKLIREKSKEFQPEVEESGEQKLKRFKRALRLSDQEEGRYLATMWELVQFKIFERKYNEEGEISDELQDLVDRLASRFAEAEFSSYVPGEWQAWARMIRGSIKDAGMEEKLDILDKLLELKHRFDQSIADISVPAMYHGGVKDLWRYTMPESFDADFEVSQRSLADWDSRRFRARQFFVLLEQLGKGENN